MRCFHKKQKVLIREAEINRARQFAAKVVGTVNYKDSNQSNVVKIEDDHFISKIGEEAVRKVFEKFGKEVKGPDFRIYRGKEKSWESDLYIDETGLAVKTQKWTSAESYGLSWTFQQSGIRKDPVLKLPESWVCFVLCNDKTSTFVCYVFPPFQIKELTFKPPKLPHLLGKKQVVYAEDLPNVIPQK
jgi:hypothetical protein